MFWGVEALVYTELCGPRGAGTGLSGAVLAVDGGVMIALTRMNRVLNIDVPGAVSPEPGEVVVSVLSRQGDGTAPAALIDKVATVLNDDEVRPLTDHLAAVGNPSWYARFAAQAMADPTYRQVVTKDALASPLLVQALDGITRCLPDLPRRVRLERAAMARNLLMHTCADHEG